MTTPVESQALNYSLEADLAYLGADRAEKMDVYLPPEQFARPLPAVLLIHGGGWRIGDKANPRERNIGSTLASHGYAVFSINYLLNEGYKDTDGRVHTTKVAYPQNLYDCKSGLRFIRKESTRFGIDPDRIAVMGGSAGGTFAMLLGATAHVPEMNAGGLYTDQRNDVACVINFYGVPDLQAERYMHVFAGATPEQTQENLRCMSPVTWLHRDMPPLLITHGTADTTIPVESSRSLVRCLETIGVDYWYIEIAGAVHSYHLQPPQMDLRPVVLTFLEKHLNR